MIYLLMFALFFVFDERLRLEKSCGKVGSFGGDCPIEDLMPG